MGRAAGAGVPVSRDIESAFAAWRFLSLTPLICAYLLAVPLIAGKWQIETLLEGLLLVTVLVTVSAHPGRPAVLAA